MHRRRLAVASLLTALVTAPLATVPASAEPAAGPAARAAERALLKASLPNVIPGERVTFTAGAPKVTKFTRLPRSDRRRAKLVLQRQVGTRWVKLGAKKLKTNKVTFGWSTPTSATGSLRLRTVAKLGTRTFAGGRLSLPVVAQSLQVTPGGLTAGAQVTFATTIKPLRKGRTVSLQVHDGTSWQDVGAPAATGDLGTATVVAQAPAYPVWYRVVAAAANGAPAMVATPVRTSFTGQAPGVIAHRAGAGAAPEQTLAAVRRALADGATAMEVDVQLTKDGFPVILHDATLARTTDVETKFPGRAPWNLADFTLADIKALDAGSWFAPAFAGETIPTLDELVAEIDGRARLVVEVKSPDLTGNETIEQVLLEEIATGSLKGLADAGKLSFSSFDVEWLSGFAPDTDVPVGVLTYAGPTAAQLAEWKAWAEEVHPNYNLTQRSHVDAIRANAMTTSLWTVNTVAAFQKALELGAERVITDYPLRLAEVLNPPMPAA